MRPHEITEVSKTMKEFFTLSELAEYRGLNPNAICQRLWLIQSRRIRSKGPGGLRRRILCG